MYTNYFTLYFKFTIIKISSRNPHIFAIFPFNAEQQGKTALPIKFSISASQLQRLERSRATTAETKNMFWPYFILLPTSPFLVHTYTCICICWHFIMKNSPWRRHYILEGGSKFLIFVLPTHVIKIIIIFGFGRVFIIYDNCLGSLTFSINSKRRSFNSCHR